MRNLSYKGNNSPARKKPSGGRDRHPGGWSAFCKSHECHGYASFRCPECKRPTCTGCAFEWEYLGEDAGLTVPHTKIICEECWDNL